MRWSRRLTLLLCLSCSPAAAQPAALPLELSWQAPSECPTASDVHAELARIASAAPGETPRSLAADVTISSHDGRYTARLTTEQEGLVGERTLQAEDCATLTRSVTLVLALAFGRGVQLRQDSATTEPSMAPSPTPAASAEPTLSASTATSPPEPEAESGAADEEATDDAGSTPSRIRFGVLLGGGAQLTLMPSVAPILTAGAALDLDALSVELRASALPGTSEPLDTGTAARAVLDGLLATALACTDVSLVNFCAGARGGAVRARSRGLFETGRKVAPWYALALSAGLSWPEQSPVQLSVEALLAISITRPRFEITGYGSAHRAPLLAPELSAFLRFWP